MLKIEFANGLLKIPRPRNQEEFKVVSEAVFGKALSVRINSFNPSYYEIDQNFDSYYTKKRQQEILGETSSCYSLNELFCRTVFGDMRCGGIAGAAYGSVDHISHRQKKRMEEFTSKRNRLSGLRPAFVRLAARIKRGQREQGNVD